MGGNNIFEFIFEFNKFIHGTDGNVIYILWHGNYLIQKYFDFKRKINL